jgi:NADPH2:quinone reductase
MNAAVVNAPNQPPRYQSFPDPEPQASEALITVKAVGLHPVVKAIASGEHYSSGGGLPAVPGIDGVGELPDGRLVYFGFVRKPWGTMAEHAAAPLQWTLPIPSGLDPAIAAAIANPGMSAWVSLKYRAELAQGETVLILGATGVAGQLAIQTARILGAKRVIAAGRNLAAISAAGVDSVIGLAEPEEAISEALAKEVANGIDVVIDYVWGRPAELTLEALAKGFKASATHSTRYVEVGAMAGRTINLPAEVLRSVDLTLKGSGFGSASLKTIFAAVPELFERAATGKLTIDIEPVPLADVETAWNRSEKGRRIVFTL